MKRIALCDDEPHMLEQLNGYVKEYSVSRSIKLKTDSFSSAEQLLLSGLAFDLVILDIHMDGMDGMEAARRLRSCGAICPIIFLTALKEYVFDAFDVDATGYLLKPVGREQLFRYIDKALKRDDDSVLIKNSHDYRKILLSDIIYCESAGRKVEIHAAKRVFSYYQKIKELSGALGTGFYMPHRSYIVNLDHVQGLSGNDIIMDNGEKVPVAKVNKEDFSRKLLEHFQRGC